YALGILSQEASIIAAKERAEMKMIEFFIPRKLLLLGFTAALNHTAPCAVKRAGIALISRDDSENCDCASKMPNSRAQFFHEPPFVGTSLRSLFHRSSL